MEIHNGMDIIDSRDVDEQIEGLEDDQEDNDLTEEDGEELAALKAFRKEGEDCCCDWPHGATLIRDSYFKEYAQDFAEEIGAIDRDLSWPNDCIDWEEAAKELQMDYSSIDFDGVDYWIR